jgi:hypothetical protein
LLEKAWSKDIRGVPEGGDSAAKGGIYPVTNSGELKDIDLTIMAIIRKSVE